MSNPKEELRLLQKQEDTDDEAEDTQEHASQSTTEEEAESEVHVQQNRFERITPIGETPWSEFLLAVGYLAVFPSVAILVQLVWLMKMKADVDVAFLPVSFVMLAPAYWHQKSSRYVSFQQVEGLQFIFHWLFSRNQCLHSICFGGDSGNNTKANKSLRNQMDMMMAPKKKKAGCRYKIGLVACVLFFWILCVGFFCWPIGYLYLVTYSFRRCQSVCKELDATTAYIAAGTAHDEDAWTSLAGGGDATVAREELVSECRHKLGRSPTNVHLAWSDPHWLIQPRGAWVIGHELQGHFRFNMSADPFAANAIDCRRFDLNTVVLIITGILTCLVFAVTYVHLRTYAVVAVSTTFISFACATGIFGVWMRWVDCRTSGLHDHNMVFRHLATSCFQVANFNGTMYANAMQKHGKLVIAFESNFRHVRQVSRSEVWFGSLSEAFLLVLVIAAHVTFRHKRMQTREARYELMCRRPRLVRCLLENISFLDQLPPRDRTMMARMGGR